MDNTELNIIKIIAQELDCGFDCFYNIRTSKILTIPNFGQMIDEDDFRDAFGTELEKVNQNRIDFIKFEVLESFESFKIMEQFVAELTDKNLQLELESVLANKKPFQNFMHIIDDSDFRQSWFDFKQKKLEKRVKTQLEREKPVYNKELN